MSTMQELRAKFAAKREKAQEERREEARASTLATAAGVERDRAEEIDRAMVEIRGLQQEVAEAEGLLRQAAGDEELVSEISAFLEDKNARLETVLASVGNKPLVSAVAEMEGIVNPPRRDALRFAQEDLGPRYIHALPSGEGKALFDERLALTKRGENLPPHLRASIWRVDGTAADNHDWYFQSRWFDKREKGASQMIAEARVYCRAYSDLHYRFRKAREAYGAEVAQIRRAGGTLDDLFDGHVGAVIPGRFTDENPWQFPRSGEKTPAEWTGKATGDFALKVVGELRFTVVLPPRAYLRISTQKLGITEEDVEEKILEIRGEDFGGVWAVTGAPLRNPAWVQRFFCVAFGIERDQEAETTPTPTATHAAFEEASKPRTERGKSRGRKGRDRRRDENPDNE